VNRRETLARGFQTHVLAEFLGVVGFS